LIVIGLISGRGEKIANTRWNQCVLFTKVSPEDLFDSWLILELARGPDFLGESHIDMGRVSLDDRPVWFPFSAKGSSSHRGSISQIINPGGNTPPGARELARRLRMRMAAGSQSQSGEELHLKPNKDLSRKCVTLSQGSIAHTSGLLFPPL